MDGIAQALCQLDAARELGAVVARDDAFALDLAARLDEDAAATPGQLHGVPVTVKDWIDVAGMPCEGASDHATGRLPGRDATAVARLRAAGAIVIAKTQPGAHHPIHGRCHHPIDPTRSPGGSSSGEAALIGAGASVLGLGSDSGGSIRLPAAWCGVVGLKPSHGLVPVTGHFPRIGDREDGRTVIGPMARTAKHVFQALRIVAGPDGRDPACVPVSIGNPGAVHAPSLRVAITTGEPRWQPASSTGGAVQAAVDSLVARGAAVVEGALGPHLDESLEITEAYWSRRARGGAAIDDDLRLWDRFANRLTRAAAAFDVAIGPVVADVAPIDRPIVGEDYIFALPWSLTGWPAISVPAGIDPTTGLPLAVQVAGPRWMDHVVVAVGAWIHHDLASPA